MAGNLDFETTLSANTNTFISAFRDATNTIANLGNSADASAQNLEQMSQYGRQHIQSLNLSLAQARAELVHLSATNATPQDIANAQNRIQLLQTAISQTTTVFDAYGAHAQNAMRDAANGADGAGAQLTQLQQEVSTLVGGLDGVRSSLDENGNSATHTRQQLEQMAENATTQLNQYKRQLEQAKLEVNRLAATNASPADIEQARQRVRELETGVDQVRTALNGYQNAARIANNEAASGANRSATAFEQVNTGVNGAKFAVNALVGAMAALGVGLGINELAQAADTYTNLSARINIATKDGGDFASAMAGVHQVALMTNSSLEATGNLFTKINDTGKEMGMTQQQALDLTKTINQAIQIGGGSAQASEAALQQFIQALQSGVLRGDEFNSIMEQAPGLTSAMAKGLGVTTGELRKMAENGELGAERITKALQSQAGQIQATYNKFPTTIGNALQRIATSWEILIGKMDQANGASSTVAQWLVVLADNIADLDIILNDIGEGFVWVSDQLKKIDPATIEALKTALVSAYDAIKSMASSLGSGLEIAGDQINSVLGAIFEFNSGVDTAADKTNGLTKLLQALNVAFGFINDGFSGIAIAANLLSGAVYAVAGGFVHLKSKILLGDAKDAAIKEYEELTAKAQEYYTKASNGAMEFKSKGIEAINDISKTQKEKDAERIADNQQTLNQLKAQEEKHKADYKAISDERIKLEQQLFEARKTGNQAAIDLAVKGLADLDTKEKAYHAESQKITDAKIQAAQEWVNAQLVAADGTQKAADLVTQKTLQTTLAAQGLKAEFSTTGGVIVSAMNTGAGAVSNVDNALTKARQGAKALGVDLDIALNRLSEKFAADKTHLDNYANGLDELGLKGKAATEALYAGWEKWLATAKSQAEIDAAKVKLKEFGVSGQLSTQQVEMGMQAVKRASQELPAALSPAEAAMERLGIKSKEQLKLAAENAMNDFNTIMKSGEATQEGLQKAYEETIRLAYASGNAQVIAAANSKAAYLGLEVQLDATGKATVSKLGEIEQAAQATQRSVQQVSRVESSSNPSDVPVGDGLAGKDHWEDFKSRRAKINEATRARMDKSKPSRSVSAFSSSALGAPTAVTPQADIANMAPMVASSFDIQGIETMQPTEKKVLELVSGGKSANLEGTPEAVDTVDQMLREFEMLKRGM